jgi:hypothetical protein
MSEIKSLSTGASKATGSQSLVARAAGLEKMKQLQDIVQHLKGLLGSVRDSTAYANKLLLIEFEAGLMKHNADPSKVQCH